MVVTRDQILRCAIPPSRRSRAKASVCKSVLLHFWLANGERITGRHIAEYAGVSWSHACAAIRYLRELEVIIIERINDRNEYRINEHAVRRYIEDGA